MAKELIGGTRPPTLNVRRHSMYRQHRSLRAWRKLLIAFRSAAHMDDEDRVSAYTIDNSSSKHGFSLLGHVLTDIASLQ